MELKGKIIKILDEISGVGKNGNPWKILPFVLETDEQYPRKVYIEILGDDRISKFNHKVGDVVTAGINIESREFNGKYFTKVQAWKVTSGGADDDEGNARSKIDPGHNETFDNSGAGDLPF